MTRDAFIDFLCEEHIPFKINFPSEQSFIYINGKDGNYIRVSHFGEHDGKLYVRDNGFCIWYSDELVKEKCRDLRDEKIKKRCGTCKYFGAELDPCDKCYYFDEWKPRQK